MKRILFSILLISGFIGCSKDPFADPLANEKIALAGTVNNPSKWKLVGISVNNTPQNLTVANSLYVKKYISNSVFEDSDGIKGNWTLPIIDSLVERYGNFLSGVSVTQGYKIICLDASTLRLQYYMNGNCIIISYQYVQ